MNPLKIVLICAAGILSTVSWAQDIKRCDGANGKVTYAEVCPPATRASTVTDKGLSVTQSDKNQRDAEAAFQKRHAQRQALDAKERNALRSAAAKERSASIKEEKMRREMKLKEDAALRGDTKARKATKKKRKKNAQ